MLDLDIDRIDIGWGEDRTRSCVDDLMARFGPSFRCHRYSGRQRLA